LLTEPFGATVFCRFHFIILSYLPRIHQPNENAPDTDAAISKMSKILKIVEYAIPSSYERLSPMKNALHLQSVE
jgi:hypothetical protein